MRLVHTRVIRSRVGSSQRRGDHGEASHGEATHGEATHGEATLAIVRKITELRDDAMSARVVLKVRGKSGTKEGDLNLGRGGASATLRLVRDKKKADLNLGATPRPQHLNLKMTMASRT